MPPRSPQVLPSGLRDKGFPAPEALLNERAQHLFRVLVERYIGSGQPVGSRTLSRDSGLDLSPATVRNVMADLDSIQNFPACLKKQLIQGFSVYGIV